MIEIEKRGLLEEDSYVILRKKLQLTGEFLGEDNKSVEYWIYSDKLLKIIKNTSKSKSVLSLKLKEIGVGNSYEEIEVDLKEESFEDLVKMMTYLTKPDQIIKGTQKRENYKIDEIEISIKWSEDWKYHVEMEVLVESEDMEWEALKSIDKLAAQLGVSLMSTEEEKVFIDKVRASKK